MIRSINNNFHRAPACTALLLLSMPLLAGCNRDELSGPPSAEAFRLGRAECAECGMIISEDRCSSATLVEHGATSTQVAGREYLLFDDVGCMLDHDPSETSEGTRTLDAFVHDYDSRAWVNARDATFLLVESDRITTPMASGIIAFATQADAERARQTYGGEALTYAALAEVRRARQQARVSATANQ